MPCRDRRFEIPYAGARIFRFHVDRKKKKESAVRDLFVSPRNHQSLSFRRTELYAGKSSELACAMAESIRKFSLLRERERFGARLFNPRDLLYFLCLAWELRSRHLLSFITPPPIFKRKIIISEKNIFQVLYFLSINFKLKMNLTSFSFFFLTKAIKMNLTYQTN